MKLNQLFAGALLAATLVSPVSAADFEVKPRLNALAADTSKHLCLQGKRIFTEIAYGELVAAVTAYHDDAVVAAERSQSSRSMRHTWALETKAWCGSAIGYSWTRTLDEETVAKCVCFHYTMIHQR